MGGSPPILSLFGFSELSDNCRPPLIHTVKESYLKSVGAKNLCVNVIRELRRSSTQMKEFRLKLLPSAAGVFFFFFF